MTDTAAKYFDAHNHLQDEWLAPQREEIVAQLRELPVKGAVVNGTCEEDWEAVMSLASGNPWIVPSLGVHPWQAGNRKEGWRERLAALLEQDPRVEVGEIGLDRWMLERARAEDPRLAGLRRAPLREQTEVFNAQLQLAARLERVATIHCIDAWGALWDLLRAEDSPRLGRGFLLHAYAGPQEMLAGFLKLGAFVSFNGYFLNERKARERKLFSEVPLERLLIETDAPAMTPPAEWRKYELPRRQTGAMQATEQTKAPGTGEGLIFNHPANIESVYAGVAALRGMAVEELSGAVEANFERLFGRAGGTRGQGSGPVART